MVEFVVTLEVEFTVELAVEFVIELVVELVVEFINCDDKYNEMLSIIGPYL